ncbi:MAG: DHH family phosphoesterase [Bacteroidales bacterium]|nr:DHH family phosphoesterase [Bacteroidales bacterium]
MQCISPNNAALLSSMLDAAAKPCIVVHTHPDGDALGSGLAMLHYLRDRRGKDARLLIPDEAPFSLHFLTGGEDITDASAETRKADSLIESSDLIFVLDLNDFARTESLCRALVGSKAPKVLIDHHLNPDLSLFTLAFSAPEASSTCELLYFLLREMEGGSIAGIPAKSLYAILTGITTDTNNFANSVGKGTLAAAGELLEAGVDREDILLHLYHEDRMERLKAGADLIANHMTLLPGGISLIILTARMQEEYGLRRGETEGMVNIPLEAGEVKMSIFLKEENGCFRVSIRAKRGWSAVRMARECFGGGGHELAAGGKLRWPEDIPSRSRDDAEAYVRSIAARFMP